MDWTGIGADIERVIGMKISVAMAAYNGALYIEEQLISILHQSRKADEVIICDDQSTDRTAEIVQKFILGHKLGESWSLHINQKNLRYASNFIGAARRTTGDLILFCDQDDIWLPERVAAMEKIMMQNPQILLLGSEFETFTSSSSALSVPSWELKQMKNDMSLERLTYSAKNIFIGCQGCTMCVRQSFFHKAVPYWYAGWAHDEFVWKLALCMDGLYMYHANTIKRRLHASNVSMHKMRNVEKRIGFLTDLQKSHEMTKQFAEDIGLEKEKLHLLERNLEAAKLRIEVLSKKKYGNTLKLLLRYRDCYHKSRAIPVELFMALNDKVDKK